MVNTLFFIMVMHIDVVGRAGDKVSMEGGLPEWRKHTVPSASGRGKADRINAPVARWYDVCTFVIVSSGSTGRLNRSGIGVWIQLVVRTIAVRHRITWCKLEVALVARVAKHHTHRDRWVTTGDADAVPVSATVTMTGGSAATPRARPRGPGGHFGKDSRCLFVRDSQPLVDEFRGLGQNVGAPLRGVAKSSESVVCPERWGDMRWRRQHQPESRAGSVLQSRRIDCHPRLGAAEVQGARYAQRWPARSQRCLAQKWRRKWRPHHLVAILSRCSWSGRRSSAGGPAWRSVDRGVQESHPWTGRRRRLARGR